MSDVSEIYVRLLQSDSTPSVVNLCSGRSVSLLRIIERMNSISGMEMQVRVNPDFVRANEIKSLAGDISLLRDITKYKFKFDIEDTISWMFGFNS